MTLLPRVAAFDPKLPNAQLRSCHSWTGKRTVVRPRMRQTRSSCLARYGAFELENQSVAPDGPAVMSVGERYGVGANLIHPIPVLTTIDRVIHPGWPNRKRSGTGCLGHDRDAPAVSSRTMDALLPRPTAVV